LIDRVRIYREQGANIEREKNLATLDDLCNTMRYGSLCALGGLTPDPIISAIKYFSEDFV
jgi:formate dehydrogenase iron-sulfur subunit